MDPQDPCCGHDRADSCSNARTNDAMWAVFYHSYFQSPFRLCHTSPPVAPRLPAELQPLELDRAVEVLVQDPGGARRQWRALVRLLMEGLHTHERYRPLLRQLAQSIHAEELQFKLENFFPADTQAKVIKLFQTVSLPGGEAQCATVPDFRQVTFPEPRVTVARVRCRVSRPVAALLTSCDAQCWDDCSGSFIRAARATIAGSSWSEFESPKGTAWSGPFFEQVYSGPTWRNLLNIDYRPNYRYQELFLGYSLHRSIDVEWGGVFHAEAPILRDRGYAWARQIGANESVVEVVKEIKYRDLTPGDQGPFDIGQYFNNLAELILDYWIEVGLLETLCCTPPA